MTRRNFALLGVTFILLAIIAIETGVNADQRVFYGLIGLFVLLQVAWLAYIFRRQRVEKIERDLGRLFSDD